MKTKKQFIIDTLAPYLKDRSLCAMGDQQCLYLTKDGKKCAFGKYMQEGPWQQDLDTADGVLEMYGAKNVLTPEAYEQNLSVVEWRAIQTVHDTLAYQWEGPCAIEDLEEVTKIDFSELKDLVYG